MKKQINVDHVNVAALSRRIIQNNWKAPQGKTLNLATGLTEREPYQNRSQINTVKDPEKIIRYGY